MSLYLRFVCMYLVGEVLLFVVMVTEVGRVLPVGGCLRSGRWHAVVRGTAGAPARVPVSKDAKFIKNS